MQPQLPDKSRLPGQLHRLKARRLWGRRVLRRLKLRHNLRQGRKLKAGRLRRLRRDAMTHSRRSKSK